MNQSTAQIITVMAKAATSSVIQRLGGATAINGLSMEGANLMAISAFRQVAPDPEDPIARALFIGTFTETLREKLVISRDLGRLGLGPFAPRQAAGETASS